MICERAVDMKCFDASFIWSGLKMSEISHNIIYYHLPADFRIQIRIRRIFIFMGLPDPDPLVRDTDPDPDPFII